MANSASLEMADGTKSDFVGRLESTSGAREKRDMCSGLSYKKRIYDPVDYKTNNKVEFWIVDEKQEGELDYDELEEMIEEEFSKTSEDGSSQSRKKDTNIVQVDDEDDLDDIDFKSYKIGDKDDKDEDEAWLR
ncbi:uncharacterized protein LOC113770047 [Coffea eugenioides]|uniref:uncharacterized protein LOC113770047 n=1 Tax=Coffea eugenioides TaxID=49369 RepID=UPI000F6153D5|nr:uncharacterized protein LOC113770047 [Coffea eugenioides]